MALLRLLSHFSRKAFGFSDTFTNLGLSALNLVLLAVFWTDCLTSFGVLGRLALSAHITAELIWH